MPITRTYVQTYQERWMCDVKGCTGEMKSTNMVYDTLPPSYPHRCDVCGHIAHAEHVYPCITHQGV